MDLKQHVRDNLHSVIVRRGETPRQTARNVYEVALQLSGLDESADRKNGELMWLRAAKFLIALVNATVSVGEEIYEREGLTDGAVPTSMSEVKHLTTEGARDVLAVTLMYHELNQMRYDMLDVRNEMNERQEAA
jgi:hypothetical protein